MQFCTGSQSWADLDQAILQSPFYNYMQRLYLHSALKAALAEIPVDIGKMEKHLAWLVECHELAATNETGWWV